MKDKSLNPEDYYINKEGYLVFTGTYLIKRGNCCGNRCKHCPFGHINVQDLNISKAENYIEYGAKENFK